MPVLEKPNLNQVANNLEAHEKVCAVRYANIEKRLDSGSSRFARVEGMIIGLYGLVITAQIIDRIL